MMGQADAAYDPATTYRGGQRPLPSIEHNAILSWQKRENQYVDKRYRPRIEQVHVR